MLLVIVTQEVMIKFLLISNCSIELYMYAIPINWIQRQWPVNNRKPLEV